MGLPVVANILWGGAVIYFAPYGEAVPADSIAVGTAWGGTWARLGYTKAPIKLTYEVEEAEVEVEEELSVILSYTKKEIVKVETVLAEVTPTYLSLMTNSTVAVTAPGAAQVGKEELGVGGISRRTARAWGIEGTYRDANGAEFPVRFFIWRGTPTLTGPIKFSAKDGEQPELGLIVKCQADTTRTTGSKLFSFQRITAAATG